MNNQQNRFFCKSYNAVCAELFFSEELWETISLSGSEKIFKPRFMVSNTDWREPDSVRNFHLPFVIVEYSDNAISYIEASSGLVREIPIFYTVRNRKIFISDCPRKLMEKSVEFNELSLREFIAFGYVSSDRTLFNDIYSLEAGDTLVFSKDGVIIKTDYIYNSAPILDADYPELMDKLQSVTEAVFSSLISSIRGKSVLLPLSAGYDSRFIAAMLKMGGFEDVTCFAWGRPEFGDIEKSREVAQKLGYKWEVIDYSLDNWKTVLDSEWIRSMLVDSSKYTSISGFASNPFLKFLRGKKNLNSVLIPGHTGDFISGGHLPALLTAGSTKDDIVSFIKEKHLILKSGKNDEQIACELEKQVRQYSLYVETHRVYELWEYKERQSKFITNTNRYYEMSGIDWNMPLWDIRFVKFWEQVPLEYKKGKRLYNDFLENNIFKQTGVGFGLKEKKREVSLFRNKMKKIPTLKKLNKLLKSPYHFKIRKDEFGFYLALPYFYEKTKKDYRAGFNMMMKYCKRFEFKEPRENYEYLARSVLAMIMEGLY